MSSVARAAALCLTGLFSFGRVGAAIACILLASCAAPRPGAQPQSVTILRTDDHVLLAPEVQEIEVTNAFGDVHLRRNRQLALAYHAVAQQIEPGLPAPAVHVRINGHRARVVVSIEGREVSADAHWNPRRARLDLALAVPDKLPLRVRTTFGSIQARAVLAPISAESVSGAIRLNAGGAMQVISRTGDVSLLQRWRQFPGDMSARTAGSIVATIPRDGDFAIDARACGDVQLVDIAGDAQRDTAACERLSLRLGTGEHALTLESSQGSITIRGHTRLDAD